MPDHNSRKRQLFFFLLRIIRYLLDVVTTFVCSIVYSDRAKRVPPIRNRLLLTSATQLAEDIRKRKVTSVEVVEAFIARIEEVQPIINAIVDSRFEEAREEAKSVDRFIRSREKSEEQIANDTPLLGVPFTSKNVVPVRGLVCSGGLVSRRSTRAADDCAAVASMRRAGAIPLAATNSSELCMWWAESYNRVHGRTSNPYDTRRTPGGSSGGEGAILGAAGSVIGLGNDIGGSVDLKALRIYFMEDDDGHTFVTPVHPEVKGALHKVLDHFRLTFGVKPVKLSLQGLNNGYLTWAKMITSQGSMSMAAQLTEGKGQVDVGTELLKSCVGLSDHTFPVLVLAALQQKTKSSVAAGADETSALCRRLKHDLEALLPGGGVFLFPTHPEPPPFHRQPLFKPLNGGFTRMFNLIGLPVTQCMTGLTRGGLPVGIQVVGAKDEDRVTLAFAEEVEKAFGGWVTPCPVHDH